MIRGSKLELNGQTRYSVLNQACGFEVRTHEHRLTNDLDTAVINAAPVGVERCNSILVFLSLTVRQPIKDSYPQERNEQGRWASDTGQANVNCISRVLHDGKSLKDDKTITA